MPIFVEIGEKLSVDERTDRQTLRPALLGQPEGIDLIIRIQPVCTHDSVKKINRQRLCHHIAIPEVATFAEMIFEPKGPKGYEMGVENKVCKSAAR